MTAAARADDPRPARRPSSKRTRAALVEVIALPAKSAKPLTKAQAKAGREVLAEIRKHNAPATPAERASIRRTWER